MAYSIKTGFLSALGFTLLCSGGCALNEFVIFENLGYTRSDAPCARSCDPYYVPPCTYVHVMDPVYFGYHPTCWTPWPEGWTGCPPCLTTVEMPAETSGQAPPISPKLAPRGSVLDELEPPVPNATDWDIVPAPRMEPAEARGESGMLLEPQPVPLMDSAPGEQISPFQEETPAEQESPPMPLEAEQSEQGGGALPPQMGTSTQGYHPARHLSAHMAPGNRASNPETDSHEAPLLAPLPEDLLAPLTAPVEWKLAPVPDAKPIEGGADQVTATEKAAMPAESPDSASQGAVKQQPEALTVTFTAPETVAEGSAGWALCSDAGDPTDSEEEPGEAIIESREGPVSAEGLREPPTEAPQPPPLLIGREKAQLSSRVSRFDGTALRGTGSPVSQSRQADPLFSLASRLLPLVPVAVQ